MGNPSTAQEPSMEEILASIRQIISEDGDASPPARAEEAGNKTAAKGIAVAPAAKASGPEAALSHRASIPPQQGGHMKSTSAGPTNGAAASVPSETHRPREFAAPPKSRSVSIQAQASAEDEGRLLSDGTDNAVSGAFSALAHTILAQNARTLEDLVSEMLRPMLREWLDDNLPTLVERIVQDEIQRVSRGRR